MKDKYIINIVSTIGLSIDLERKKLMVNYSAYSCDSSVYEEFNINFCPFSGKKLEDMKIEIDKNIEVARLQEERRIQRNKRLSAIRENVDTLKALKKFHLVFKITMEDGTERFVSGLNINKIKLDFPHITKSTKKRYLEILKRF
jgi:hypothetical protein